MNGDYDVAIWQNGNRIAEVTVCSKNVSLNDLMFTLLSFDRAVREKNKEAQK